MKASVLEYLVTHKDFIILSLGFLLIAIASNRVSHLFQGLRLPIITGFILTGILSGPYVLQLLPLGLEDTLSYLNDTTIAFIAFVAGAEMRISEFRGRFHNIRWHTFGLIVVAFLVSTGLLVAISGHLPILNGWGPAGVVCLSLLISSIFVASSPASAIAVMVELKAKGPYTQTVLGVTVIKDFLVILLFSFSCSLTRTIVAGEAFSVAILSHIFLELLGSALIGMLPVFALLRICLQLKIPHLGKAAGILLVGYGAYAFSNYFASWSSELGFPFYVDPLIVCILGSFTLVNFSKHRQEFQRVISETGYSVYVAFFTLLGATINLYAFVQVVGMALLFFLIRIVALAVGSYVGGYFAGDARKFLPFGWMPFVTQAGVAIGLTTVIIRQFPELSEEFTTTIVALVVMNLLVGPSLFKWYIFRANEDRVKGKAKAPSGGRSVIIVGYEPLSLALSHQLTDKGWKAQMVTTKKKGTLEEPDNIPISYVDEFGEESFDKIQAQEANAVVLLLSDEQNLSVTELFYRKYGTRDIIVRTSDRSHYQMLLSYGAKILDPSTALVSLLDQLVRSPEATSLLMGMKAGQETRDVRLFNNSLRGEAIRNIKLPSDIIILSVERQSQTIITHGDTRVRINDILTMVGSPKSLDEVQLRFGS